jgi:hypothetical protein
VGEIVPRFSSLPKGGVPFEEIFLQFATARNSARACYISARVEWDICSNRKSILSAEWRAYKFFFPSLLTPEDQDYERNWIRCSTAELMVHCVSSGPWGSSSTHCSFTLPPPIYKPGCVKAQYSSFFASSDFSTSWSIRTPKTSFNFTQSCSFIVIFQFFLLNYI